MIRWHGGEPGYGLVYQEDVELDNPAYASKDHMSGLLRAFCGSFHWAFSTEGNEFWEDIYKRLRRILEEGR